MTSVRTKETHSLLFSFFAVQLFLIIVLALNTLVAYAEPPIRMASSDETFLSAPSVVTILTRDMPAPPMQALLRSVLAFENFRNCGLRTTIAHHLIDYLENFWSPFQPSEVRITPQLTIQRTTVQSTILPQNLLLSKPVL